ncbi:MAG TPA: GNAT family N-acetyltransferase, partial [Candidatus Magasanikbacteria bacterium]|nr:GNAT family N-acetyltransferase [Candidatus Magasanikbacteria bacterium]
MKIQQKKITTRGIKFFIKDGKKEIGRAYLYILKNDLHKEPFGFLEDV